MQHARRTQGGAEHGGGEEASEGEGEGHHGRRRCRRVGGNGRVAWGREGGRQEM